MTHISNAEFIFCRNGATHKFKNKLNTIGMIHTFFKDFREFFKVFLEICNRLNIILLHMGGY